MYAYVDASVPRLPPEVQPNYKNGFICCWLPSSGFLVVEEIPQWETSKDTLPIKTFIDTCELAAIKLALSFGADHVFSDSQNAVRMAKILKFDVTCTWIAGHKNLVNSSEEEMLMRVPHKFATANQAGRWIVKATLPVGRNWIQIVRQIQ